MLLTRRFLGFLRGAVVAALPVLASAACNAQVATVLRSDAGSVTETAPSSDAGPVSGGSTCVANGGICVGRSIPPANYEAASATRGTCEPGATCYVPAATPACTTDGDCNGDISVSSLWGTCFFGICVCRQGLTVQPNGKCNTAAPRECALQGGTCHQTRRDLPQPAPPACGAPELGSAAATDTSCVTATLAGVCCNPKLSCNGPKHYETDAPAPVDFNCCGPAGGGHAPICVNGWQTCPAGFSAVARPSLCD